MTPDLLDVQPRQNVLYGFALLLEVGLYSIAVLWALCVAWS